MVFGWSLHGLENGPWMILNGLWMVLNGVEWCGLLMVLKTSWAAGTDPGGVPRPSWDLNGPR